jgi:hypothetical protein
MAKTVTTAPVDLTVGGRLDRLERAVAELAAIMMPHLGGSSTSLGPASRAVLAGLLEEVRSGVQREKAFAELAADEERIAAQRAALIGAAR